MGAYIIMAILMGSSFFSQWNLHENMVKSLVVLGCWIILCLPPYLLITNFLRVWEKLPLLRSRIIIVKALGVILYLLLGLWLFSIATSIEKSL